MTSAKLLMQNGLFENSISMSYYAMYNLLFKTGIKCENHGGAILLLKLLIEEPELHRTISDAKAERIDKQYYVVTDKDEITKEIAENQIFDAEKFNLRMKLILQKMNIDRIRTMRQKFNTI